MSTVDDRMKVDVMMMPSENGLQLALERYDEEPSPKDPRKLIKNRAVDLVPVEPEKVSKKYSGRKGSFVDLNLGELLGLGVLGQYFHSKDNDLYDVVLSVEDSWHKDCEKIISDGALMKSGNHPRMIVQQVMAQDLVINTKSAHNIEEQTIQHIADKNLRMTRKEFPEKSALLVNVYSLQERFDIKRVVKEADLTVFATYYLIFYKLPELNLCHVVTLGGYAVPPQFKGDAAYFQLTRYENPWGEVPGKKP